jgi:hypothetical protein
LLILSASPSKILRHCTRLFNAAHHRRKLSSTDIALYYCELRFWYGSFASTEMWCHQMTPSSASSEFLPVNHHWCISSFVVTVPPVSASYPCCCAWSPSTDSMLPALADSTTPNMPMKVTNDGPQRLFNLNFLTNFLLSVRTKCFLRPLLRAAVLRFMLIVALFRFLRIYSTRIFGSTSPDPQYGATLMRSRHFRLV